MEREELNPEDAQGEPREEAPKEPQNPLTAALLRKSLKKLSRTYSGLSYAYIELDLKEKELDEIGEELNNYTHLRDINISMNKFPHVNPVQNMTYLVRLDASKNEIRDMEVFTIAEKLQFLQILNLKENKIKELPNLQTNSLTELNLETNLVETCGNYTGLPSLTKLNLNQNRLKSCEGLVNMPEVKVIYLNENNIKSMKGLDNLPKLRKLRLKINKIENLLNDPEAIPDLPSLEKLNISENKIKEVKQFSALKFPKLKKINVDANPYFEEANAGAKIEILIQLEDLGVKFVNKEEILPEDKDQAKVVKEERIQKDKEEAEERERQRIKEEEERKEKEEEERKQKEIEEMERKQKEEEERLERLEREREAELERQKLAEQNMEENPEGVDRDMEAMGMGEEDI